MDQDRPGRTFSRFIETYRREEIRVLDIQGYGSPKLRKLVDKFSAAGYYIVVPDFFHGDPLTPGVSIQDWLNNHAPEQAVALAKPVIEALKEKGVSKIGVVGFSWGGVKVLIAILGAEIDQKSLSEVVKQFEATLEAKPEVNWYPWGEEAFKEACEKDVLIFLSSMTSQNRNYRV